jgi:hypothetical protein
MWGWLFSSSQNADVEAIVKRLEDTRVSQVHCNFIYSHPFQVERELALREAIVERKNDYKVFFN